MREPDELISPAEVAALMRRLDALGRSSLELVHAALGGDISLSGCARNQVRYLNSALERWERKARRKAARP